MEKEHAAQKKAAPILRTAVQVICFILLPSLFIQIFNSIKTVLLLIFHGQGTFLTAFPSILLLFAATAVTAVAGRFFCGWMCAFGSVQDFLYKIPRIGKKNPRRFLKNADHVLKWVKYVLLAGIVVLIWGFQIAAIPAGTNPWDLFGMLVSFGSWPTFAELAAGWLPAAGILLAILAASALVERFFCRYLCPLGAYFSLVSARRPLQIAKRRKNCGSCSLCTRKCSMGIALGKTDSVRSGECIDCMACTANCPFSNAHLEMSEQNRNALAAGALSCALIAGAYYLGNFTAAAAGTASAVSGTQATSVSAVTGMAAALKDGTYTGSGRGFRGTTTVAVQVSGGLITDITVESTGDNAEYMNKASSTVIAEIIKSQSTDVDTVAGATYSSNAILDAVADALSGSSGDTAAVSADSSAETSAETSAVTSAVTSAEASSEVSAETSAAAEASAETSAETSAAAEASAAAETGAFTDGTYTGSGTGLRGETDVTVTVSGGKITAITIDSYQDDRQFFEKASSTIISEVLSQQSVDVDAVSGATYSSNGILEAVADALNLDFTPFTVSGGGGH